MKERTPYDRALRLLALRARSVAELRRRLLRAGCAAAEVEETIARLCEQRLLDDTEFARQFTRSRLVGAGASRFRIAQELGRKGISRAVAERALEAVREAEGIDATAVIHQVAEKKLRALAKVGTDVRRRRLYAFLARRGFNPDEIAGVLHELRDALTR